MADTTFDVFVSYARKDNEPTPPLDPGGPDSPGWITAFIEALKDEHRRATGGKELNIFFDKEEIRSMDNWEWRILRGLRQSKVLLAFLSPHYFASEWCRREWEAWIEHEISRHILSEGIAPIYYVEVPGFPDSPHESIAAWVDNYKRRQWHIDLRPFVPEGVAALRREGLRARLTELEQQIRERAGRAERAAASPNTVPPYNPCFVGRLPELHDLFDLLSLRRMGVVAAVHGLGGLGKTELAFTYAHAFAHEYPGGRYLLHCAGQNDLRLVLCDLAADLAIRFTDDESKSLDLRFRRLRAELDRWGRENGRVLLVLDNVDHRELLSKAQTDQLNLDEDRVHLLATTRLEPPPGNHGGARSAGHQTTAWLAIDELPVEDAVRLLEKHRPFSDQAEADAARSIAEVLGGFTLAVETVAIYLANEQEATTYAGFLKRLQSQILPTLDELAAEADVELRRHNDQKLLRELLKPSLDRLTEPELLAVQYAALLPADQVPLPWLRALVSKTFSSMAEDGDGSRPSPWNRIERTLFGLRLLQSTQSDPADRRPLIVRAHRLVQDVVRGEFTLGELSALEESLSSFVKERDVALEKTTRWTEARWEIEPLDALARLWGDRNHGQASWLLNQVGLHWHHLAEWTRAEPLMRRSLAIAELSYGRYCHPNVARGLSNLALLLLDTNRFAEAEPLLRRAMEIDESSDGKDHPTTSIYLNNLASLLHITNRFAEAEPLMRQTLDIDQLSYGKVHPNVARSLNNLALLLRDTNRFAEAEPLMRRALEIDELSCGEDHPRVAGDLNNLALLLLDTNRLSEAEPLLRRALEIDESSYGKDHPAVSIRLNNLASLLMATNRLSEAEPLLMRAVEIDELSYGEDHPRVAEDLNNLAQLLKATSGLAEAEPLMRRALEIEELSYGEDHPSVARDLNNLALLLQDTNRLSEAEPLLRRALEIDELSYGKDHPSVSIHLNNLASLLMATNRLSEAEPLLRRALEIDQLSYGEDHPRVAGDLNNLASLLTETNRLSEAEPLLRWALDIDELSFGKDHPSVSRDLNNLALLLQDTNRLSEAEPLLRRALEIDELSFGKDHPNVAIRLNNLGLLLLNTNRLSEAEPLLMRALKIDEFSHGKDHPEVAIRLNNLAILLYATKRVAEAAPLMRQGLEIFFQFTHQTGHVHPHLQQALKNFAALLAEMGLDEKQILNTLRELAPDFFVSD